MFVEIRETSVFFRKSCLSETKSEPHFTKLRFKDMMQNPETSYQWDARLLWRHICYPSSWILCHILKTEFGELDLGHSQWRVSSQSFDWGGGGQIQVSQNHLPLNSDFSSDFAHFDLEILTNPKILVSDFWVSDFWFFLFLSDFFLFFFLISGGQISHQNFELGDTSSSGDAHGQWYHLMGW